MNCIIVEHRPKAVLTDAERVLLYLTRDIPLPEGVDDARGLPRTAPTAGRIGYLLSRSSYARPTGRQVMVDSERSRTVAEYEIVEGTA